MNIIFFSRRQGRARQLNLAHPVTLGALGALTLGILGMAFILGLELGQRSSSHLGRGSEPAQWAQVLADQKGEIADLKQQLQERVDALAMRMGQVNAHVIRLDALGKRLTVMADIDTREFNFDSAPPTGGPESEAGTAAQIPDITLLMNALEDRVDLRSAQLAALENVLISRDLVEQIQPEGRPVRTGYISSYFGERQDPFTGHEAFHKGVDFAGLSGSEVVAVAAGVVTWSGERSGYGKLVEINHGNGFVTRYGHNRANVAQVGQTVSRGDTVAQMGSTGRSTGPHVHFEVLRNGRQVDPLSFVGR